MIAPGVLLGFAALLAFVAPALLRRSTWLAEAPRAGVWVWLTAEASLLVSFGLALGSLCSSLGTMAVPGFVAACIRSVAHGQLGSPAVLALLAGLTVGILCAARLLWTALRQVRSVHRLRKRQRVLIGAMSRRRADLPGVLVIDRSEPAAFCVPHLRGGDVVVTTGALVALDRDQLSAVLAHERAHLRGRHDVVLACAAILREALPFIPLFRVATTAVAGLVEMAADDVAVRASSRRVVATALVRVAGAPTPVMALGAGGSTVSGRVRRLADPTQQARGLRAAILVVAGAVLASAPVVGALLAPAVGCPFTMPG